MRESFVFHKAWRFGVMAVAVIALGLSSEFMGASLGQNPPSKTKNENEISAGKVKILDKEGRERIVLAVQDDIPSIFLFGHDTKEPCLVIYGDDAMPNIHFRNSRGRGGLSLGIEHRGSPAIRFWRKESEDLIVLGASTDGTGSRLDFFGDTSKQSPPSLSLGLNDHQAPYYVYKGKGQVSKYLHGSEGD